MISPSLTPEECAVIRYALERAEQPPPHWPHVQTAFNKLAEAAKLHEDDAVLTKAKEIEAARGQHDPRDDIITELSEAPGGDHQD